MYTGTNSAPLHIPALHEETSTSAANAIGGAPHVELSTNNSGSVSVLQKLSGSHTGGPDELSQPLSPKGHHQTMLLPVPMHVPVAMTAPMVQKPQHISLPLPASQASVMGSIIMPQSHSAANQLYEPAKPKTRSNTSSSYEVSMYGRDEGFFTPPSVSQGSSPFITGAGMAAAPGVYPGARDGYFGNQTFPDSTLQKQMEDHCGPVAGMLLQSGSMMRHDSLSPVKSGNYLATNDGLSPGPQYSVRGSAPTQNSSGYRAGFVQAVEGVTELVPAGGLVSEMIGSHGDTFLSPQSRDISPYYSPSANAMTINEPGSSGAPSPYLLGLAQEYRNLNNSSLSSDLENQRRNSGLATAASKSVRIDEHGVKWIEFPYSICRVTNWYRIRCDIEIVEIDDLDTAFKEQNCVYRGALMPTDQYKGNRRKYEMDCNSIGWRLCKLNPILQGRRGLIQRAVDSFRNTSQDQSVRSRRVRRLQKQNRYKK